MIYNIREELTILEEKRRNVDFLVEDIKYKTEEYEKSIECLKNKLIFNRNEVDLIRNSFVSVRLGDLIDEISWLSGVSKDKISISLGFSRMFSSLEDASSFVDDINDNNYLVDNVKFSIKSNLSKDDIDDVHFSYFSFLSFDFNEIQYDGKMLKEHCYIPPVPFTSGEVNLTISICKDIDDVICKIPFYDLENRDNTSWYPADLFRQALINASLREYNSNVDKIRKRVK